MGQVVSALQATQPGHCRSREGVYTGCPRVQQVDRGQSELAEGQPGSDRVSRHQSGLSEGSDEWDEVPGG